MTAIDPKESDTELEDVPTPVIPVVTREWDPPSAESVRVGARLDAHHLPETNGWMAVCRRCGMRTDGPTGLHVPHPKQLVAAEAWIEAAVLGSSIAKIRERRDT